MIQRLFAFGLITSDLLIAASTARRIHQDRWASDACTLTRQEHSTD
jgi:hypothetical protein